MKHYYSPHTGEGIKTDTPSDWMLSTDIAPLHEGMFFDGSTWYDFVAPTPSLAELTESVRIALQSAIDDKAKSFGFSAGNALMLYAGFVNPFQPLAQVFATWEATVWVEAEAYKAEVIAGTKPMLTGAEAVSMMPAYPA